MMMLTDVPGYRTRLLTLKLQRYSITDVDPSVRTILVGHSMGGIVAADTLIAITSDTPIDASTSSMDSAINAFMFPYIQGVLAFDTHTLVSHLVW